MFETKVSELLNCTKDTVIDKDVYFLWSGGDDSTALLKIFIEANIQTICRLHIITIPFPWHVYHKDNINLCEQFFKLRNIEWNILGKETDIDSTTEFSKACLVCKSVRRKEFDNYFKTQKKKGSIIVTGHNLSDLMAYYAELAIAKMSLTATDNMRKTEVLNKFITHYETENEAIIFRPMLNFSQNDIQKVLSSKSFVDVIIGIVGKKCTWLAQRKRLLQEYFIKTNIESNFKIVYELVSNVFGIPSLADFRKLPYDTFLV